MDLPVTIYGGKEFRVAVFQGVGQRFSKVKQKQLLNEDVLFGNPVKIFFVLDKKVKKIQKISKINLSTVAYSRVG